MRRLNTAANNIIVGTINHIFMLVFPFIVRAILIRKLGIEYLGISTLFSSILGVLSLADLGFSSAAVFFMYTPTVEKNQKEINALLSFYKKVFKIIGSVIFVAGCALLPFLDKLISGTYPHDINIYVIYLIQLISTVSGYLFFSYKSTIITANQRYDIESIIYTVVNAVMYINQIILLLIFANYYTYAIALPVFSVLTNIIRSIVVDRLFPQYKCEGSITVELKKEIYKKIAALFGHKLNMKIIQTADSIVISSFLGLAILGKYSNYFYILSALAGITSIITESIRPIVGHSLICENKIQNLVTLKNFLLMFSWIIGFCCTSLICLFQNWIFIWVGGDNLLGMESVVLFAVYFWIWKIGDIFMLYRDAGGFWLKVKYYPYISAVANLVTNIILVKIIGINGVILSTVLTLGYISVPREINSLFKNYFQSSAISIIIEIFRYTLITAGCAIIAYLLCNAFIPNDTLISFALRAVVCLIVPNSIFYLLCRKSSEFMYFKNFVVRKIKGL